MAEECRCFVMSVPQIDEQCAVTGRHCSPWCNNPMCPNSSHYEPCAHVVGGKKCQVCSRTAPAASPYWRGDYFDPRPPSQ